MPLAASRLLVSKRFFSVESLKIPAVLPELAYDYNALEPYISAEIMRLHHSKHHQAYINNFNVAIEKQFKAESSSDISTLINLQSVIKFNGGGHINHSIFWKNLCPVKDFKELEPSSKLNKAIGETFGSLENLQKSLSANAASVQGSGWAWLGFSKENNRLVLATTPNQDPVSSLGLIPILGIDVWEHAYYLQYKNVKVDYLKAIWNVINWNDVSLRYDLAIKKE